MAKGNKNITNSQILVLKPFNEQIDLPSNYVDLERINKLEKLDDLLVGVLKKSNGILGDPTASVLNVPIKMLINFEYGSTEEKDKNVLNNNYQKFAKQIYSLNKALKPLYNHPSFYKTKEQGELEVLHRKMINDINEFAGKANKEGIEKVKKDIEDLGNKIREIRTNAVMLNSADLKYELESQIGNLIGDAYLELEYDWKAVNDKNLKGYNISTGKKAELIKYLREIYGNDSLLLNLEKETNPEEFLKKAQNLNIESIADNVLKKYLDVEKEFDDAISEIIDARRNFLNDINEANSDENEIAKIRKNFEKKYTKNKILGGMNSQKKNWVQKMRDIYGTYGFIDNEREEKVLTNALESFYDDALKLNENNSFPNDSLNKINDLQLAFKNLLNNKYLFGINPKEKLNSLSYVNQNPSWALNKKDESWKTFNEYGNEVKINGENDATLPWNRTFFHKKICKDQNGKNVSLMALRDSRDVIIRENVDQNNNSSFKVYVNNNVNVPLNVLTDSRTLRGQKPISIYHHDRNGTMHESTIIHREIRKNSQNIDTRVTFYELTKGSYLTGTELNLDKVPGIRVGLIAEEKPKVNNKNEQIKDKDGNPIMETVYKLSILSDQVPMSGKTKKEIEKRYGDRVFKGPDGQEMTINEMLKKNMVAQKDPYQKPKKPQTLEERKAAQRKKDVKKAFKGGLNKAESALSELHGDLKNIATAPKRKIEEKIEEYKETKRRKIEDFENSFNDARNSLINRFDLDDNIKENNRWDAFGIAQDYRENANKNLLVVTRNCLGIGNKSLKGNGDLDLFSQYYDLRENLVNLNNMMNNDNFKKLPEKLQKQIKEKIIEINTFVTRYTIFDDPTRLQDVILIKKEHIIHGENGKVKNNKPFDLQLHEIRRKDSIDEYSNINKAYIAPEVVKFKQEVSLIDYMIRFYNVPKEKTKINKINNLQNHLNKELDKDYGQLNGEWEERSKGFHTNREAHRNRSGSNLSRGGRRTNPFDRIINDDL